MSIDVIELQRVARLRHGKTIKRPRAFLNALFLRQKTLALTLRKGWGLQQNKKIENKEQIEINIKKKKPLALCEMWGDGWLQWEKIAGRSIQAEL